jgi:transposase-like protein
MCSCRERSRRIRRSSAAVELVLAGRRVKDVAESLGCSDQSLHNWVKQHQLDRREHDDGLTSAEREELRELRERDSPRR